MAKRRKFDFLIIGFFLIFLAFRLFANDPADFIKEVLKHDPKNIAALNAYGIELAKRGSLLEAIKLWRSALDISPKYIHLYNNIGSALRRMGYFNEALDWYKTGLQFEPTFWTWYNLGLLREDLKQFPEAIQAYEECLKLNSGFSQANDRLTAIQVEISNSNTIPTPINGFKPGEDQFKPPENIIYPGIEENFSENKPQGEIKEKTEKVVEHIPKPPELKVDSPPVPLRLSGDEGGSVFLTFDGGADADGLPTILEELGKRGVKSTFFLTGKFVTHNPELAKTIIAQGHEIANHSMTHPDMSGYSSEKIADQIKKAEESISSATGRLPVPFFRFPFGAENKRVEKIVESLGYKPIYWTIDTLDWKEPSVASIVTKVSKKLKKNAVILMHCGSKNGSKALAYVLNEIISRGYSPTTLSTAPSDIQASFPRIDS
ncbi:MAG: polysaccharide deacetylase family protein [Candidatus Riflebacteria bacterium]|nr:polysaccharide deacetylase family protein [Candidatus Riflebacteria bacterium]